MVVVAVAKVEKTRNNASKEKLHNVKLIASTHKHLVVIHTNYDMHVFF